MSTSINTLIGTATLRQLTPEECKRRFDEYSPDEDMYYLQCSACASTIGQWANFITHDHINFVFGVKFCWNCGRRFVPNPNDPALAAWLSKERLQREVQLAFETMEAAKQAFKALEAQWKGGSNEQ